MLEEDSIKGCLNHRPLSSSLAKHPPPWPLGSCVGLNKVCAFSVPQFAHLESKVRNNIS